jgi:hypothetical protein
LSSDTSNRKTAIWVASLWIVTAIGAIAGLSLMSSILHAPDFLTTVFPQRATVIGAAFLWLINDLGIVAIGLLMFPILKKQSEVLALGYVSMRMLESVFLIVGMLLAMLLIPLSKAFIESGSADAVTYQTVGSLLVQAETWFMASMQFVTLGLGGLILTFLLFRARLVPRWIAVVGIVGYALLLPYAVLSFLGVNTAPGTLVSMMAIPVALWEIIIMPIRLFARGFNKPVITVKQGTILGQVEVLPAAV